MPVYLINVFLRNIFAWTTTKTDQFGGLSMIILIEIIGFVSFVGARS